MPWGFTCPWWSVVGSVADVSGEFAKVAAEVAAESDELADASLLLHCDVLSQSLQQAPSQKIAGAPNV